MNDRIIRFGQFELRPERGQLLSNGVRVDLGSRALAILSLLADRSGKLVTVQELTDHVWPNTFVQENNLRVHLTAIRRALRTGSDDVAEIVNVPGRGYRFDAEVSVERPTEGPTGQPTPPLKPLPLPIQINRLIGREDAVNEVVDLIARHRLVTLVGAGGIGKTSAALAALSRLRGDGDVDACFVDLTNCTTREHLVSAAAGALQTPLGLDDTLVGLVDRLKDSTLVMLVDNCEHLIGIAAEMVEAIVMSCPGVKLLTTSREPLRIGGEMQVHLQPLTVPSASGPVEEIVHNASVILFAERALAATGAFRVTEQNAGQVAMICRSLDGLPLALELAAAAVPMVGLDALSTGLVERMGTLAFGRRTLARHETLEAMMDWSFDLLSTVEQDVFARLSLFRSSFDLSAAVRIATSEDCNEAIAAQAVLQLAAKSLLVMEPSDDAMAYRLLETTKSYARRKLAQSGNAATSTRHHAEWVRDRLERAKTDWTKLDRVAWWERYGRDFGDVRAALDWALSPIGDNRLGVALTVASAPLWLGTSHFAEFRDWLEQALQRLEDMGESGGQEEIDLQVALFVLLFNAEGHCAGLVSAANRALEIAERIGNSAARATALWALQGERHIMADYAAAAEYARRMAEPSLPPSAETDLFAQRVLALTHFRQGRLAESSDVSAELIGKLTRSSPSYGAALRYDHSTAARANYSMTLAIKGELDTARSMMMEALVDARRIRNPTSFCYLLSAVACPVALWLGDDELARHYVALLTKEADENRFNYMAEVAAWYSMIVGIRDKSGRLPEPLALDRLNPPRPCDKDSFITTCAALCDEEAFMRARTLPTNWATAEVLRAKGENLLREGEHERAQGLFREALAIATEQGAWLWALRASNSLALLLPAGEGQDLLTSALARVSGDELSQDVAEARVLLDARARV
jgi:predicted ATPase/DNA-binding winged helix-turn-helix (wHTH) protein